MVRTQQFSPTAYNIDGLRNQGRNPGGDDHHIRAFPLGDFCHPGFDIFVCRVDRMGDPHLQRQFTLEPGKIGNNYGRGTFQGRQLSADQPNGPAAQYQHRIFRMDIGRFQAMPGSQATGSIIAARSQSRLSIIRCVRCSTCGRGIRINSLNPPGSRFVFLNWSHRVKNPRSQ